MFKEYNYIDFREFLIFPYYLKIGQKKSSERWLRDELALIDYHSEFITQYHYIKCEHLEFFYFCFKSVSAIDEKLFEDFIKFGWRGVVWAAWISCITPYPEEYMTKQLQNIDFNSPYNDWLVNVALNILTGNNKNEGIYQCMNKFRNYMGMIPRIEVPLRPWYNKEYFKRAAEFQRNLKNIYINEGTDAAIDFFHQNKCLTYNVDYKTWVQNLSKKQ